MDERVSGLTASGHRMAESLGREVTMFDQQGIWAMNQAHHQELLEVAGKALESRRTKKSGKE